jgi:arabinofuranosyltransferase
VLASVALVAGWSALGFLCDDAYIAFRYVSNSQLGHGYTWNATPFQPVEGYSSFLWVVLLDWIWTLTGIEPPETAQPLGLAFGFLKLACVVALVDRMTLPNLSHGRPWMRNAVLAVVLLGTLTNRTFLAWTSSGLETSMFDAFVLCWLVAGVREKPFALALCAALLELSRPDGLLFCAATVPLVLLMRSRRPLLALSPLLIPVAHEIWRVATYCALLPNTYYAKVADPWPLMGSAFLGTFVLENGWYLLLPLAVWGGFRLARDFRATGDPTWPGTWVRWILVGTLAFHVAYYTFRIGGDHFDFRIYAWTVPLVWIGAVWMLDRLAVRPSRVFGWLLATWFVGLWLPWTLWAKTNHITVRRSEGMPTHDLAPYFPWPVKPVAMAFDALQDYTIGHFVGMRTQTHIIYLGYQKSRFPDRAAGSQIRGENPVLRHTSVGYPAWTLPHVHIIDEYGLNDPIIARNPEPRRRNTRLMAHERKPPRGYVECFRPDIAFDKQGKLRKRPAGRTLTDDDIIRCQQEGWEALDRPSREAEPAR